MVATYEDTAQMVYNQGLEKIQYRRYECICQLVLSWKHCMDSCRNHNIRFRNIRSCQLTLVARIPRSLVIRLYDIQHRCHCHFRIGHCPQMGVLPHYIQKRLRFLSS